MSLSHYQALAIAQFGDLDCLQTISLPLPQVEEEQVLIKLHYAAVNPIDCKTRAGLGWAAEQNKDKLPWVGGYDMVGEVFVIGKQVQSLQVGDLVAGMVGFPVRGGCYGQYLLAKSDELIRLPDNIDVQQAAALPLAGLTAMQGLFTHGRLQKQQRVIISAAAGGVGHVAVQLAKQAGAEVIALASTNNHRFLTALGADVIVDYHDEQAMATIAEADLLLDLVGGESGLSLLGGLKTSGRVVTVPTLTKEKICSAAELKNLEARGMLVSPNREQLQVLYQHLAMGELKIHIANVYPLLKGQQAQRQSQTGHVRGKLLLKSELL